MQSGQQARWKPSRSAALRQWSKRYWERRSSPTPLCKIHHGKLDEFEHLAARCVELVRTKDTGTLQYELYFNSDNTEFLVLSGIVTRSALLDHHKNLGDTMAAILRTCSGSGEICGTPIQANHACLIL